MTKINLHDKFKERMEEMARKYHNDEAVHLDDMEAIAYIKAYTQALTDVQNIVRDLFKAVDMATDLLPVPEHVQDDDWRDKEQQVYAIYHKYKDLAKLNETDEGDV